MLIDFNQLFRDFKIQCNGIIHIGANKCQEAAAYHKLGIPQVVWVEAIPEVAVQGAVELLGYTNQTIINACLSDIDGKEVTFNISNNEAQSSSYLELGTHRTAHPEVHYVKSFKTTTARLDSLINHLGIEIGEGWILCADTQGSEYDVLVGAGELLHKFDYCYLEVNEDYLYKGCHLKDEISEYLNLYGFVTGREMVYKQWGWGDAFFIRKTLLNVD